MKTVDAILAEVRRHKSCSKSQLRRYFVAFDISPLGVRQRPQLYPDDTAERILENLGFNLQEQPQPTRIVTMRELRAERSRARKARAV